MRALPALLALALALPGSALAEEPKKQKKSDAKIDELFGDTAKPSSSLEELKRAADGVSAKTGKGTGLGVKGTTADPNAPVHMLKAFAASKIEVDKKLGCQPAGKDKKKLVEFAYDEVPAKGPPLEVCVSLASAAGREMHMSVAIVDPRGAKIASAEDVVNFAGVPKLDHVLEFPPLNFKNAGPHFYVIDMDGKEVGRLELFVVKVGDPPAAAAAQ